MHKHKYEHSHKKIHTNPQKDKTQKKCCNTTSRDPPTPHPHCGTHGGETNTNTKKTNTDKQDATPSPARNKPPTIRIGEHTDMVK